MSIVLNDTTRDDANGASLSGADAVLPCPEAVSEAAAQTHEAAHRASQADSLSDSERAAAQALYAAARNLGRGWGFLQELERLLNDNAAQLPSIPVPRPVVSGAATPTSSQQAARYSHDPYSAQVLRPHDATPVPFVERRNSPPASPSPRVSLDALSAVGSTPTRSSSSGDGGDGAGSRRNPPVAAVADPTHLLGVVHVGLAGRCQFLRRPASLAHVAFAPGATAHRLFFGQLRFESTAAELHWLVASTCGVSATKVEPRGPGCFVAHFATADATALALSLHKRVLCDVAGVWYASTPQEAEALASFIGAAMDSSRFLRLPRGGLVVEDLQHCRRRGAKVQKDHRPAS